MFIVYLFQINKSFRPKRLVTNSFKVAQLSTLALLFQYFFSIQYFTLIQMIHHTDATNDHLAKHVLCCRRRRSLDKLLSEPEYQQLLRQLTAVQD